MAKSFSPHYFQDLILKDIQPIIIACAGVRSGKTTIGAIKLITWIQQDYKKSIARNYLIVAPTFRLLQDATLPTLFEYWPKQLGEYKKGDSRIELSNGAFVFVRSATDPDQMVGFNASGGAWLDEAGQYTYEVWQRVQQRLTRPFGEEQAPVIISSTPYGMPSSWLNRELIEKRSTLSYVSYYNWSTKDNPYISTGTYEIAKATLPSNIFSRDYEGKYTLISGLIFPDFSRDLDVVAPFQVDGDEMLLAGADYGFSDPTCFLIIKKGNDGFFYVIDEFYKSKSGLDEQSEWLQKYKGRVRQVLFDPSAAGWFDQLQKLSKMPFMKADNGVTKGIGRLTRLLKTHRLKIFSTCPNLIRDLESYVYKDGKDLPSHDNSHGPDALRYAFSLDLFGIYPELRKSQGKDWLAEHTNADGIFVPPPLTLANLLDIKPTPEKEKKYISAEKPQNEAFQYDGFTTFDTEE